MPSRKKSKSLGKKKCKCNCVYCSGRYISRKMEDGTQLVLLANPVRFSSIVDTMHVDYMKQYHRAMGTNVSIDNIHYPSNTPPVIVGGNGCWVDFDQAMVHGNRCTVNGAGSIIAGDYCDVYGDFCIVYGNNCRIWGNNCKVYGENCVIRGVVWEMHARKYILESGTIYKEITTPGRANYGVGADVTTNGKTVIVS